MASDRFAVHCLSLQAAAKQRAGRAGRVRPGMCFALYTRDRFNSMSAFQVNFPCLQKHKQLDVFVQFLQTQLSLLSQTNLSFL